jgi:hypothetical protein
LGDDSLNSPTSIQQVTEATESVFCGSATLPQLNLQDRQMDHEVVFLGQQLTELARTEGQNDCGSYGCKEAL